MVGFRPGRPGRIRRYGRDTLANALRSCAHTLRVVSNCLNHITQCLTHSSSRYGDSACVDWRDCHWLLKSVHDLGLSIGCENCFAA